MRNWWIKFGCFLTGYNYNIVRSTSEVVAKSVKRYTSALVIISILWAFIGYSFTSRYIKGSPWQSFLGAIVLVVIAIQIERQIILAIHKNKALIAFRSIIAILMAIIGSIIIDQIIFKEDIEQRKIVVLESKVKKVYPSRAEELKKQIAEIDTTILKKEQDAADLINDLARNPTIKSITTQSATIPIPTTTHDSTGSTSSIKKFHSTTSTVTTIPNPKIELLNPINEQLVHLRRQKQEKDNALLELRATLQREINAKVGFIDELNIMMQLLSESPPALFVWLIWVIFLLGLELFIMASKFGEKQNDYDETIKHQMDLYIKQLELIAQAGKK